MALYRNANAEVHELCDLINDILIYLKKRLHCKIYWFIISTTDKII